jgi:hypothetical protein
MSNLTFSSASIAAITDVSAALTRAEAVERKSYDTLHAEGARSTDFVSPKSKDRLSTATPEMWEAASAAIVAGYTPRVRKLLAAPTKALSEVDKADKRYWQMQIGSRLGAISRGLAKREGATDERGTKNSKAAIDKLRIALETAEKIVQAETDWTFDAADFLKDLRALNRKIK